MEHTRDDIIDMITEALVACDLGWASEVGGAIDDDDPVNIIIITDVDYKMFVDELEETHGLDVHELEMYLETCSVDDMTWGNIVNAAMNVEILG